MQNSWFNNNNNNNNNNNEREHSYQVSRMSADHFKDVL